MHETFVFATDRKMLVSDAGIIGGVRATQADGFRGITIGEAIFRLNQMGFQMCGVQSGEPGSEYTCCYYFTRPMVRGF